jgi:Outer membrane efflux protein
MEEGTMSSRAHEPREEFVNALESRLRGELRRQRIEVHPRLWAWMPQSRWVAVVMIVTVIVGSMALGGGVVAATYEARLSQQRDVLLRTFEERLTIAQQRLALANRQLTDMQQRVSVGIEPKDTVLDLQVRVKEAEVEVESIKLDIAEIKATGREPINALSAPLVSGRDFVSDRWRVEMTVPVAALAFERTRADAAQHRVDIGIAKPEEVEAAKTRIVELEAAVRTFERKLAIRQTFLKGGLAPSVADLRGLEAEGDVRRTVLVGRIDSARRRVQDLQTRVDVGTSNAIEVAEAKLRLQELELQMTKVDYDLVLIRRQLEK